MLYQKNDTAKLYLREVEGRVKARVRQHIIFHQSSVSLLLVNPLCHVY